MSRLNARLYYENLLGRIDGFSLRMPEGLDGQERASVEDALSRLRTLANRALQVLEHDDPRHPGL